METIALTMDGKKISCPSGISILEAADQHGIKIPHLCYHPDLKPFGACRMCLVEEEKTGRLMAACVTPVAPDMVIQTESPRVVTHRRNIARLMIAEHPESCIVCSKGNRCRLRQVAAQLGVGETNLYHLPNFKPLEQANPFIIRDLSKCILCGKCIRADHELVVVGAIDYNLRGFHSRPATVHELGLERSNCTFCGTCVSMCPTGALSTKNSSYVGSPDRESNTICGFCGVGCTLAVGSSNERVTEVNPAHLSESVNGATLCVRGHFAHDFLNSDNRLISPLIRKDADQNEEQWAPVAWEKALDLVAQRLMEIKSENGPQSIAFLGSSKCTNEENYLFQKIARVVIGTNNVDNGGYTSGQFLFNVFDVKTDGGCRINPLSDMEKAEAIFVLGADPNHSVPVISYYLKKAALQGTPIVVVDPRKTELVKVASFWLRPKLQTDLELINALAALLHEKQSYDPVYIDNYTEGFSLFRYSLSSLDLDRACGVTGIDRQCLAEIVDLINGKKIAFVVGHGILQQKYGMHTLGAIFNVSLLTGSLAADGGGIYVLARENNQIGAMDMGTVPHLLPGRQALNDDRVRKQWEKNWNVKLSPDPGLNMVRMIEAAEQGNLKAMYIMGENPLRCLPQPERVQKALAKLDFLVVQDILNSETAQMADVVLAAAAFSEKHGSFTNLEGRIQSFHPAVVPPGNAKSDWEILDLLIAKMNQTKGYETLEKIRMEIRKLVPAYAQLDGQRQGWITQISQKAVFNNQTADGLITFYPLVTTEAHSVDSDYPFSAIVGSLRYHLGSGTRTNASERIQGFDLCGQIEISPEDGAKLEMVDGDSVKVISPFGAVQRTITLKKEISPGEVFVPIAVNSNDAMNLIELTDLADPNSPGWKTVRVKLEKV
ncbi:MAG: molybdopterin-dependent oxidoreductase [Desulfobacterales bacterium]|nr:MAG: molybdopterin-dependent oxidoreductase [Desulfobacterales bacterium]